MAMIKTLKNGCRQAVMRFLNQSRGVIAMEAAVLLIAFATVVSLVVDLGTAFAQQSRLERATYTAASVLRERISLYNDPINEGRGKFNQPITREQVTQLRKITNHLLSRSDLVVIVEELQFAEPTTASPSGIPVVLTGYPVTFIATESGTTQTAGGPGSQGCKSRLPNFNQSRYTSLSPWSSRERWLPIYRVTVCYPGERSWFKSIVNSSYGEDGLVVEELIAYNIVIPR